MIVWETLYPGERATELQAVAHPERLRDVGVACATPRGPDNPPPKKKFPCLFSRPRCSTKNHHNRGAFLVGRSLVLDYVSQHEYNHNNQWNSKQP